MFGMQRETPYGGHCAGRGFRRGRFGGPGWLGRHGMGGDDTMRAGRMLAQGDLRLIALALIAEQPRHGYEIIKLLEEKTSGWYSPSPGIVYPTLTYLEDVGYISGQVAGSKNLFTITDEGRAHLQSNRDLADAVLDRLSVIGERVARWRRMSGRDGEDRRSLPPLVEAAIDNLRQAAAQRLETDAEAEARVVEILARAATELKRN